MHYDGSFDVTASKEEVYDFITDPMKLTTIFPAVQSVSIVDEDNFTLKARVGMSFISGTVEVKGSITDKRRPTTAKLNARGTGFNSSVDLESTFTMEDGEKGGTHVSWAADAKMSGMIAGVGSRVIDSAADRYVKQIVESLEQKLS